ADISIQLTGTILDDLRALINPFKGHANEFNVEAAGETVNVVGEGGIPFPETPHGPEDDAIEFNVEANDYTIKAGEEDIEIHVGTINADIVSSLATLTVTCEPQDNTHIATVKVTKD